MRGKNPYGKAYRPRVGLHQIPQKSGPRVEILDGYLKVFMAILYPYMVQSHIHPF